MKKILLILIIILTSIPLFSQQYKIEKSTGFEEPERGWNKVLQLKNGNTLFFHAENKKGITVVVYDKSRKEIARKIITGQMWDVRQFSESEIAGLYDINGDAVLFLVQVDKELKLTLYRLRISATTADVIKEEVAGNFPPVKSYKNYTVANIYSKILVEKDPVSDCYAVILKKLPATSDEFIRVLHYNGTHELLNDTYYALASDHFSTLSYIGCAVDGDKRIYIATAGEAIKSADTSKGLVISCLRSGEKTFRHQLTTLKQDFIGPDGVMLYNPKKNTIQLLTVTLVKQSSKSNILTERTKTTSTYLTLLSYIDPENLNIVNSKVMNSEKVGKYASEKIDPEYNYSGLPQQMIINKDNTTTILSEEKRIQSMTRDGNLVREDTYLGAAGIAELSDAGVELRGYAISKKQMAQGVLPEFHIAARPKGTYSPPPNYYGFGNTFYLGQFISIDYINAPGGRYVIFNDLPVNYEKGENERKRKLLDAVSESNTICCKLGDDKIDKFYLFGEPENYRTIYCYIAASDYNRDNNTYATLLVEHIGRKKEAKIAWVTFE